MSRIYFVSQKLPSSCGIARHHQYLISALSSIAPVIDVSVSGDASKSQSLLTCFKVIIKVLLARPRAGDVLFVELAGRFLCQFYAALLTTLIFRQVRVVTYLHDVPSVVGNPRLFREFDRKHFRWISRLVFPYLQLERLLLRRSIVIATNEHAKLYVEQNYNISCAVLPLVYSDLHTSAKLDICFVPGPIEAVDAGILLSSITSSLPDYIIHVGFVVGAAELNALLCSNFNAVKFLGFLDDNDLQQEYINAKIIVRYRNGGAMGNSLASSGPVIFGAAANCIVFTNDPRGSSDYFDFGAGAQFIDPSLDLGQVLTDLVRSPGRLEESLQKNRDYYCTNHSVSSAVIRLRAILFTR